MPDVAREGGFTPILPRTLDHAFRGHVAAIGLLVPVVLVKSAIAFGTIFNGRAAAGKADGLPLEQFGAAGTQAVLALFAIWGVAQLAIQAFGVLALVRYRAMIPLVYVVLLLEHLVRRWTLSVRPIASAGAHPGGYINLALVVFMLVGLAFALWRQPMERRPRG